MLGLSESLAIARMNTTEKDIIAGIILITQTPMYLLLIVQAHRLPLAREKSIPS
jgi:hypothetical protein